MKSFSLIILASVVSAKKLTQRNNLGVRWDDDHPNLTLSMFGSEEQPSHHENTQTKFFAQEDIDQFHDKLTE